MRFVCLMLTLTLIAGPAIAAPPRALDHWGEGFRILYAQGRPTPDASPLIPPAQRGGRAPRRRDLGRGGRERALEGVRRGEIRPLEEVMAVVQRRFPGRVLDVRLDERRLIYHLRVLSPRGNVLRLRVDARNARILSVRGRR